MNDKNRAQLAIEFLESLTIPEGKMAGEPLTLAPFQRQFIEGSYSDDVNIGILSIGRGNAKTALSAGLALGELVGAWDTQPRREIIFAARTQQQALVAFRYVEGFIRYLAPSEQKRFVIRQFPRGEITFDGEHMIKAVSSEGKSVLGTSPTFAIMDERGHWHSGKGDELEHALLSGLGKRDGRSLIISTSASDDAHAFSVWLDDPVEGTYRQEHKPDAGLPADDLESLKIANPGSEHGIGFTLERLQSDARRAMARGGATLTSFRLYNRNERVSAENRDVLLTVDEWLGCETDDLPQRKGQVVVGLDLGGSASMSAASFYWPETGRLECRGTFPSKPDLQDRGAVDGVRGRYLEMQRRGELSTLGDRTVPIVDWIKNTIDHVQGQDIAYIVADRFKQSEVGEAIDALQIRTQILWRGMVKDSAEDCERFRRAVFDGQVKTETSLLLRSAFAETVINLDASGNMKLAKGRSKGRIDPASATVLAVAQGARMQGHNQKEAQFYGLFDE